MLGSLLFAAALSTSGAPLDAATLKAAMQDSREAATAAPVGRTFRVTIPFVDGRKRNLPTFQSPARWVYDYKRDQLDLIIGPGEITPLNYDQFDAQGLDKLPALQSFVFDSREVMYQQDFTVPNNTRGHDLRPGGQDNGRGATVEFGKATTVYSFGIAAPYDERGDSGLPQGFKPLSIHKVEHLPARELHRYVSQMSLILEGETTDLGQKPPMFCGDFNGGLQSKALTGPLLLGVRAKQCFVTARITKVSVVRGGEVLASWPREPATAD